MSINGVTWMEGGNPDVYKSLWNLGFDHFTTDYPETMFQVIESLKVE